MVSMVLEGQASCFILLRHEISTKPYRVRNSHDTWGRHLFRFLFTIFSHLKYIWPIPGWCSLVFFNPNKPISYPHFHQLMLGSITVWQRLLTSLGFPMFSYRRFQDSVATIRNVVPKWQVIPDLSRVDGVGWGWIKLHGYFVGKNISDLSDETLVNLIYSPQNERMSPETQWLEDVFPIEICVILGDMLVFGGVEDIWWNLVIVRRYFVKCIDIISDFSWY